MFPCPPGQSGGAGNPEALWRLSFMAQDGVGLPLRTTMPNPMLEAIKANRHHAPRVAVQTGAAVLCVHLVMRSIAPDLQSWAILSALLTIGTSADASLRAGLGRIAGAVLGTALGLSTLLLGGPVLLSLVVAAVVGNVVGAIWPALGYTAVLAAIVALDPTPENGSVLGLGAAAVFGAVVGAAASFVVLPVFGRDRAALSLRRTLEDCREFLRLIERGVTTDDRRNRDRVHRRFRSNLSDLRSRISETRFAPQLRTGAWLIDTAEAVEAFWSGLGVLDRVITNERHDLPSGTADRILPALEDLRGEADGLIDALLLVTRRGRRDPIDQTAFREALARARASVLDAGEVAVVEDRALQALVFALNEIERTLLALIKAIEPLRQS